MNCSVYCKQTAILLLMLLSGFSIASEGVAFEMAKNYDQLKGYQEIGLYIGGVGEGISTVNVYNQEVGIKPVYCPPKNLAVTTSNYVDIFERQLASYKSDSPELLELLPISNVLLFGLINTFPCQK